MAGHNVLTTESWFCPHIALSRFLLNTSLAVQFVGEESKDGVPVAHFTVLAPPLDQAASSAMLSRWTKTEIYLDFHTLRPVALDFNIHPDDNANLDIPVEVRFSNYANSGGVWIPFTVEKYINSTLDLKLQVVSASMGSIASTN